MAVTEGTGGSANDAQSGQELPEAAVKQMLSHVSQAATQAGGAVVDVGGMLWNRARGMDSAVGEEDFEERAGVTTEDLVAVAREAAEEHGVSRVDEAVHVAVRDKIDQHEAAQGITFGPNAYVRDRDRADWTATSMLHEIVHAIVKQDDETEDHGPLWKTVYLDALKRSPLGPEVIDREVRRIEAHPDYND